jgi:DHA1 family bicyclomycin/chloramphenicol resistance-like MFS transporter
MVLLGLQPVVTDMILPALPGARADLGGSMMAIQFTMFGLILSFGLFQLIWGVLADRVGRQPILRWGLVLLTISSGLSAIASQIELLIVARIAQGATLAAVVVCGRAMVRDLYEPREGAQVLARGLSGLGLIAIVSPLLGGMLADFYGWRSTLFAVTVISAAGLWMVWRGLPETLLLPDPRATSPRRLYDNYRSILSHPAFWAWSYISLSSYGGLFLILSGSPFIYIQWLGLSPGEYGMAMSLGSVAYVLGTFYCRRLIHRQGLQPAVKRAAWFSIVAGILIMLTGVFELKNFWAVWLPQMFFCFGHGIHQPVGQAGAPGPFPFAAGAASSLNGLMMALAAFFTGLYLSFLLDLSVGFYFAGLAAWSVSLVIAAWFVVPRYTKFT